MISKKTATYASENINYLLNRQTEFLINITRMFIRENLLFILMLKQKSCETESYAKK